MSAISFENLQKFKKAQGKYDKIYNNKCNYMAEGMCLGLCIGTAIDKEWMSLGVLVSLVIGALIKKNKSQSK